MTDKEKMDTVISEEDSLDFTCPFCKEDVGDGELDKVILGEKDNPDEFNVLSKTPKVFMHVECYEDSKKENE